MVQTKPLYVATTMDKLNELAEVSKDWKDKKTKQLCTSAETVLKEAINKEKEGDEELAYVYYMKFFSVATLIRKASDYENQKKLVKNRLISNKNLQLQMDKLSDLKESLQKRYKEIRNNNFVDKVSEPTNQNSASNQHHDEQNNDETVSKQTNRAISTTELFRLINDLKINMLIMDCRSDEDYKSSRILYERLINIPQEEIVMGLSAHKLGQKLSEDALTFWATRGSMDLIVLIDWDSSESINKIANTLLNLCDIFFKWDPDVNYENKLRIVDGGYESFIIEYPMYTSNPHYRPIIPDAQPSSVGIEEIEYPLMEDIKMKSDIPKRSNHQPVPAVDRVSKLAAEQLYIAKKPVDVIYKQREELVGQQLKQSTEIFKLESTLVEVMNAPPVENGSISQQNEWFDKQQELNYKLFQKQSELFDTTFQTQEIDDVLETLPVEEIKQTEISQTVARMQAMEEERQKIELERKKIIRHFEDGVKTAREQKRHLQNKEGDEELIKPKQPLIDRSVKPSWSTIPQVVSQRNFNPEHGSVPVGATGLKNLGNTCYMNSIIQCLLNLEQLCAYFKSRRYEKDLNRKSRSKGQIAEELAAVCIELWSGKYKYISPRDLRYVIGQYEKAFSGYEQQDSHEFLTILMDYLHLDLQFSPKENIRQERLNNSGKAWREFVKDKESIIQNLFFGQIRSMVKCRVCEIESFTYEGFSNLSLELPITNGQCNLADCLNSYFDGEIINGWNCPHCKTKRDAIKKLDISKLPPILVIHFKRFYVNIESTASTYKKKTNFIRFPIVDFNISGYITRSLRKQGVAELNLCAVSNHYGTMERGHYTAFCKNYKTECWYKFDDSCVTKIEPSEVISSAAYILFYSSL